MGACAYVRRCLNVCVREARVRRSVVNCCEARTCFTACSCKHSSVYVAIEMAGPSRPLAPHPLHSSPSPRRPRSPSSIASSLSSHPRPDKLNAGRDARKTQVTSRERPPSHSRPSRKFSLSLPDRTRLAVSSEPISLLTAYRLRPSARRGPTSHKSRRLLPSTRAHPHGNPNATDRRRPRIHIPN